MNPIRKGFPLQSLTQNIFEKHLKKHAIFTDINKLGANILPRYYYK